MTRYRYRTPVLAGPWRDSRETAHADALRARQALFDDSEPSRFRWVVPGWIEEEHQEADALVPANNRRKSRSAGPPSSRARAGDTDNRRRHSAK